QPLEITVSLRVDFRPVNQPERPSPNWFAPQEDIRCDIKVVEYIQLLMNEANASAYRLSYRTNGNLLVIDANLPAVRLVKTYVHLHQSRFAGAVFSRQGNDFTVADVQVYGIERDDSGESFADSLHFEHGLTHPNASTTATKPIDLSSELRHIAL